MKAKRKARPIPVIQPQEDVIAHVAKTLGLFFILLWMLRLLGCG